MNWYWSFWYRYGSGGQGEEHETKVKHRLGELEVIDQFYALEYALSLRFVDKEKVRQCFQKFSVSQRHSNMNPIKFGIEFIKSVFLRKYLPKLLHPKKMPR